ncbi:invasin [Salmonella enterica subsp. enterica serovar Oranienburg]|uniref:inverse autotransporter beta domain-containing protein n=1 Tax=Salmonella enterica TaxID=28901 RepID=UPI000FB8103B|nr:invasin [Salmonella enterica subsp. enterica serovar Oranienburg]EAQ2767724.1 invasin [Salmonella enterica]ECC9693578.1 invasin [Salmonella enterica subsp. enterica]QQL63168.1 inverse autotransporter beta domain-containing protein [Salmonella enterica subsp. enterica serovar Othmarschen]EAB9050436.1 invasin [Salmonella enterica subsp. enterica serovar Oranienburg]
MKFVSLPHPSGDAVASPALRRLAWFNIAVQVAFPLAVAFPPAMAGEQHFLPQPAPLSTQRTQVYTLGPGETAISVAKKFDLTLNQLRELNQLRTFAHGLNGLQPGDDVDVPLMAAKDNKNASDAAAPGRSASAEEGNEQAQKVAGYASQAGSFLASSAKSDAAASMARNMATVEAGGAFQQWLSHFGTARVQLDADKNFSLKNSQFDLLLPLYDQGDNFVFTQGSLHRTDSRTQASLGAGWRHSTSTYMLGGNLFGDFDLSRDHARAGAGLEYWRNFLKLGVNSYLRLSGWKDSPDLEDYQERPANGWDVRGQAWVPSLPQLGGKLTYEQYYGKEVALFGVDSRQRNPHAITVGINYTPVPLITLGAEQRQGQSGKSDTRLTLNMNYHLGVPWRAQVDPTAVAAMRSLAGSQYDLVERNNNIVLEYRKKEIVRLKTADLVTGYTGEQKSLGVSVNSRHGLERIDWDASALNAAGGKIVQNGRDYAVVLPAYQSSAQGVNTYTVSGVAVDTKGNRSSRSDTQVTVQATEVNKQTSTFTPVSSVLLADGKSTQVLTLMLLDENNQPVDMDVKDISLNSSVLKSSTISALTRKSAGVYAVTVTAGRDAENVTLTPVVNGTTLSSAVVTISSVTPDGARSTISTDAAAYVSGSDMAVTVTLKDTNNNVVAGAASSLTADTVTVPNAILKAGSRWRDNGDGTYTATYTATTVGTDLKATVRLGGWDTVAQSGAYAITAATPDGAKSAISTDATAYVSGSDMVVTVTLKDGQDNPVTGAAASLTADTVTVPNAILKAGSRWRDNGDGTYTAAYTATTAGSHLKATVRLGGRGNPASSDAYAIMAATPDGAKSAISTDATAYVSGSDMAVTVTLKDGQDNAVTGTAASLTADAVTVPNAILKAGSRWRDNGDGTYTATYTATTAGTNLRATVRLGGWSTAAQSGKYGIILGYEAPASINTQVNAYTFTQTSEEGTFPTTGFTGATFTIVPKDSKSVTDYTWTSDASWVSVTDGVVKFTGTGTGDKVTITGTPTSSQGNIIKYSFTLKSWFIHSGSTRMSWSDANTYCSSQSGYSLPTIAQMILRTNHTATLIRGTGALLNEWGMMTRYTSARFSDNTYWSSDQLSSGSHNNVSLRYGGVYFSSDSSKINVVCRQGL